MRQNFSAQINSLLYSLVPTEISELRIPLWWPLITSHSIWFMPFVRKSHVHSVRILPRKKSAAFARMKVLYCVAKLEGEPPSHRSTSSQFHEIELFRSAQNDADWKGNWSPMLCYWSGSVLEGCLLRKNQKSERSGSVGGGPSRSILLHCRVLLPFERSVSTFIFRFVIYLCILWNAIPQTMSRSFISGHIAWRESCRVVSLFASVLDTGSTMLTV